MTSFLELHRPGSPLLIPNPWDAGSAKVLASLGFQALATTSSGYAATLGRPDYGLTRDEALSHAASVIAATNLPVSADLENGFALDPEDVAVTVRAACEIGLAGCSIEDTTGDDDAPIVEAALARERVAAAVEAADEGFVITARAENLLHGRDDSAGLADAIARLQSFQEAGAHVLYAPGLTTSAQVRDVVGAVDRPVNVLAMGTTVPVAELASLGVARISVGGSFAFAALGALVEAATELRDAGTFGYTERSAEGSAAAKQAFVR